MPEPGFDLSRAHRWFAVEANNLAWQLAELSARTASETDQMIEAAHVARHHWAAIGTPLNMLRAQVLLATACALAHSDQALRHALLALELADGQSMLSAFDRACLHGAAALAFGIAGDDTNRRTRAEALRAALGECPQDERPLLTHLYTVALQTH